MKKQNWVRGFIALTALALCLSATPAMAASHARHTCVSGAKCTYAKTGTHNAACERGTHKAAHASKSTHSSHASHRSSGHH